MKKSIFIALILFSASFCFSQNSEVQAKDIISTTSASKSETVTPIPRLKEEVIGRPPMPDLGTPSLVPYNPSPSPTDDNTDKRTSRNKKTSNTSLK